MTDAGFFLFIAIFFGTTLIAFNFIWRNILLALAGMIPWIGIIAGAVVGYFPQLSLSTNMGVIFCILFAALAFVPLVRYISMVGKVKLTKRDEKGSLYELWGKPEQPKYISRAKAVQQARRAEMRSAIDRASGTHRRRS